MQIRKSPPASGLITINQTSTNISHSLESVNILSVWERLGGGQIRRLRARAFWRQGDGWSVSIEPIRGLWRDFAAGEGGGVLRLIETVLGLSRGEAWAWLEAEGFIPARDPISRTEAIELRRERQEDFETRRLSLYWKRAKLSILETRKAQASETDNLDQLTEIAQTLFQLKELSAEEILNEYGNNLEVDPEGTNFLVNMAVAEERECESLVWLFVDRLAKLQQGGDRDAA